MIVRTAIANGDGTETRQLEDVPLIDCQITHALSAPQQITGTLAPEDLLYRTDLRQLFVPWKTVVYVEDYGTIRACGLISSPPVSQDGTLTIEAQGFTAYPDGQAYTGADFVRWQEDPAFLIRKVWDWLQSRPKGNLGLTLGMAPEWEPFVTPFRVGERTANEETVTSSTGKETTKVIYSYENAWRLTRWGTPDLGAVLDELYTAAQLEYVERHWYENGTPRHHVDHARRLGARRRDLRFQVGENILEIPQVSDGEYWSGVQVMGKGEGAAKVVATYTPTPRRLWRVMAYDYPTGLASYALTLAQRKLNESINETDKIDSIVVRDTPLAPLGSWSPGDEIRVSGDMGWLGWSDCWHRVISTTTDFDRGVATIQLTPVGRAS